MTRERDCRCGSQLPRFAHSVWTPKQKGIIITETVILNLVVALGIGLLIGAERERRKGQGPARSPAGYERSPSLR